MSKIVLVSAPYMIPVIDRFRDIFTAADLQVVIPDVVERLSEQELLRYAGKVDAVISGDDRFTEKVLEAAAPRLKVISKWGTGIDSIDQSAAERLGIKVLNTPDAFTDAVADSAMAYILTFARQTPWMDRMVKSGRWEKIPSRSLKESTLGVVGVGRIGKALLRRAKPFGMRLLGNDIQAVPPSFVSEVGLEVLALEEMLAQVDFLSLHCDLNPTSYHLITRAALRRMRPTAVLVNTARGPVVDETALIESLQKEWIAGAALDRKSTRLNSSHTDISRMPSSA